MDGFICFDSSASINFMGSILVNYKGLRLIRFRKSQLMMGEFVFEEFKEICLKVLKGESPEEKEALFTMLKEKYPNSTICVIGGGISKSTGHLAELRKGEITALIY